MRRGQWIAVILGMITGVLASMLAGVALAAVLKFGNIAPAVIIAAGAVIGTQMLYETSYFFIRGD